MNTTEYTSINIDDNIEIPSADGVQEENNTNTNTTNKKAQKLNNKALGGGNSSNNSNSLEVRVNSLEKVGAKVIQTVWGVGYKFDDSQAK